VLKGIFMKKLLGIGVAFLCPVIGITIATIVADRVYPDRPIPEDASYMERTRIINQGLGDASARGVYIMWGALSGAATGMLVAVAAYTTSKPESRKPPEGQDSNEM
jgi:hypothetical protein